MRRRACWTFLLVLPFVLTVAGCGEVQVTVPTASTSTPTAPSPDATTSTAASTPAPSKAVQETIVTGLSVPWGLAFLPGGAALVTLRDKGEVLRVAKGTAPVSVGGVPGVAAGGEGGEGGLLGIAVSPRFSSDKAVFVYFTASDDNRVMRMTYDGSALKAGPVILKGIPKADHHDGGRLAFGPDDYLYVATGDAGQRDPAQDKESLSGKILRVTTKGEPAPGNPFPGSPIWSLGHRNVQGLAWDKAGVMYASEFGQETWDELNRIEPGRNYGWPHVEGIASSPDFVNPLLQWPTADASPSGIAVGDDGAIYMAALRGQSLWRIPLRGNGKVGTPERLLQGKYGRLRTVESAPDGRLWLVTSNTFRGPPNPGDDRVLALPLPLQN